jgi:hypothetical protein
VNQIEHTDILKLIQLMADFGMLVLLWIVQLVIYPSFTKMRAEALVDWHAQYTHRISYLIMPLMLTQLGLGIYTAWTAPSVIIGIYLVMIVSTWLLTFFISVPLHNKISQGEGTDAILERLIQTNWLRTVIWTAIFLLGVNVFFGK